MFSNHQPLIEAYARQHPDHMARVLIFTVLTAHQPLYRAVNDMEFIDGQVEEEMRAILFGYKAAAYMQITAEKREIFRDLERIERETRSDRSLMGARMVDRISRVSGFAAVKAGFAAQMVYGVSGCLDTHNLRRLGIAKIRVGKKYLAWGSMTHMDVGSRYAKSYAYQKLVDKLGGAEKLWNDWCVYVSQRSPKRYPTPMFVSELHSKPFT